ncbi:exonuclease domain-containing protein [Anditalea andensis]|uniref:BRCT domain-containing protein n=1 Tax=Anditalea andensis TaxID=1048983 RepID=A0A074KWA4_9BACT|nr:exonuclease domain-containing protein [Anditalea andensis]KEO72515.1 hypothetical protein EL17_17405 [Anditalea andensis]
MDFIAIDFETANRCRESACAIGLTYVENMKIVDQEYHLIKPTPFYFDAINQCVHGITEAQVEDAATFDQVWSRIKDKIHGKQMVAHNASFDFSVLRYALSAYQLPFPEITYGCTLQIFRKVGLPLKNYKLSSLARYYDLKLDHHHALSDSVVCAQIALALMNDFQLSGLSNLVDHFGFKMGSISQTGVTPFMHSSKHMPANAVFPKSLANRNFTYLNDRTLFLNHKTNLVVDRKIILSGSFQQLDRDDLAIYIHRNGGKLQTSVSSKTDFIIFGKNMGPSKKNKAHLLNIPMISEEAFIKMLDR